MRLPRTVVALGLVSLFNDLASEIVVPLIPILLTTVLGAGPVALGVIEGVADAVAAFLKLWSGRRSDALGGRRKGLTVAGYLLSNFARPLLGLAGSWTTVLLLRSADRVGKGLRTAPRDALIADAASPQIRGYAYGFNRALDNLGAVGGSLLAAAVLTWSHIGLTQMILWSAIPGLIAILVLVIGVQDTRVATAPTAAVPPLAFSALTGRMRRYLAVVGVFTLARASETFILLLGHQRGGPVVELLLLWAALNFAKATTSTLGGRLADRISRGAVVAISWSAFSLAFALLAVFPGQQALWLITVAYGLFAGFGEGAERAVISDFAAEQERGTAFGWYNLVLGLAAIPGGLLFGGLWHYYGAAAAFLTAGALAFISVVLLASWAWPRVVTRA
jgi:MFS family permease